MICMTRCVVIENPKLFTKSFCDTYRWVDVILSMDWLSKYRATVDCFRRRIVRITNDGQLIEYLAKSGIITSYPLLKVCVGGRKNLECLGMIFVLDGELGTTSPSLVDVVESFWDVFPDELSGLPQHREIEFCIDLIPIISFVSIPLYRMAPVELAELRKQLDELLEK